MPRPPTLEQFAIQVASTELANWSSLLVEQACARVPTTSGAALILQEDNKCITLASAGVDLDLSAGQQDTPEVVADGASLRLPLAACPQAYLWLRTSSSHSIAEKKLRGALAVAGVALARELQTQEMEKQRVARDHFFSMVNHDLKGPLASIKAMSDLLVRKIQRGTLDLSTEEGRADLMERLGFLSQRVKDLAQLIDEIGEVSNIERGRLQLHLQRTDLNSIVGSSVERLARESGRTINLEKGDDRLPVYGDAQRLVQVINILLRNATNYSPADSPVTVEVTRNGAYGRVAIRDQGEGIPPEQKDRLFREYGRAIQAGSTGLGVGLYTAAALVSAHKGEISLQSEVGTGTTARVTLPLSELLPELNRDEQHDK